MIINYIILTILFSIFSCSACAIQICGISLPEIELIKLNIEALAFRDESVRLSGAELDSDTCILDTIRTELLVDLPRSDERGFRCLKTLADSGGNKAAENFKLLRNFRRNTGLRIACEKIEGERIDPIDLLSERPRLIIPVEYEGWGDSERQSYLFHEQFHLLGYSHENGLDFADICERCCFDTNTPDISSSSCRSCAHGEPI